MINSFCELTLAAFQKEIIKKLVFSRPKSSEIKKISARLCAHRGTRVLALEYFLPGDTVSHKNVFESELCEVLLPLTAEYSQVNLITTLGDAELKKGKNGKTVILGEAALRRKMSGERPSFEKAIESLDFKPSYILNGNEDFLIKLGISDKNGRVHDKKQGKFRQINRFLENIRDVYKHLPSEGKIKIYDLCCGKSYLSFAVYHYFAVIKGREVKMTGVDLKGDVIEYCSGVARSLGFDGLEFLCGDVNLYSTEDKVDMVVSLHACDVATDIVIGKAIEWEADVILSTPCCHHDLNKKLNCDTLSFIADYSMLRQKLCDAATDALRLKLMEANGYETAALELIDPEETPKNIMLRGIRKRGFDKNSDRAKKLYAEYESAYAFLLGREI